MSISSCHTKQRSSVFIHSISPYNFSTSEAIIIMCRAGNRVAVAAYKICQAVLISSVILVFSFLYAYYDLNISVLIVWGIQYVLKHRFFVFFPFYRLSVACILEDN